MTVQTTFHRMNTPGVLVVPIIHTCIFHALTGQFAKIIAALLTAVEHLNHLGAVLRQLWNYLGRVKIRENAQPVSGSSNHKMFCHFLRARMCIILNILCIYCKNSVL